MSKAHTISEAPLEGSSLAAAACHQGWLMADEAIRHLEGVGILPSAAIRRKKRIVVSPKILMELAALLRLTAWQEGGLCDLLQDEEVSTVFAALDKSEAGLTSDPQAFAQEEGLPPLTDKVFGIWEKYLAWSGLEELSADVLLALSPSAEEDLLKGLADLLWKHRHTGQDQSGS